MQSRAASKLIVTQDLTAKLPQYPEFQLVGYTQECSDCQSGPCQCQDVYGNQGGRLMLGVDGNHRRPFREPRWRDASMVPWEQFSYGEYIGPYRTPHVAEYRVRIRDQLEFVYLLTREQTESEYRLNVGDTIAVVSSTHPEYSQPTVPILSDGSISLPLIGRVRAAGRTITELQKGVNDRFVEEGVRMPEMIVQGVLTNTPLNDLRDAVDARAGVGGQSRTAEVSPDGTIQLPLIHSVPAIGLTLKELAREVNARYREKVEGVEVTPILVQRAPRIAYVLGEVVQPGRIELVGPTTAMQAIALAQGWNNGGNLRQIVVFRRDANWNLMATRLDLAGALFGKRPYPSDEIWLRDGDIVLVPKQPIMRLADAIDLYVTRTVYAIMPNQGIQFDSFSSIR
jgi:polysaccharide export outer membrane protein